MENMGIVFFLMPKQGSTHGMGMGMPYGKLVIRTWSFQAPMTNPQEQH